MHASVCDVAGRRFAQVSGFARGVCADGVVCMMRAFGSGGRLGPSSFCPAGVVPLLGVIAGSTGYDLAVVERRDFNAQ